MANDWTKMTHDLPDKPETIGISSATGIDVFGVVGRLHRVWVWFDRHTTDGLASGVTPAFLDSLVAHEGFAAAMTSVGWLVQRNGRIALPNFDRHNSKSAKARALSAERMKRSRYATSATEPQPDQRRPEKDSGKSLKSQSTRAQSSGSGRLKKPKAGDLTLEVLRDPAAFATWVSRERSFAEQGRHSIVPSDDHFQLAYAARTKALDPDEDIKNPVGFVKGTLIDRDWSRVRQRHEDAARSATKSDGSAAAEFIGTDFGNGGSGKKAS